MTLVLQWWREDNKKVEPNIHTSNVKNALEVNEAGESHKYSGSRGRRRPL